MITDTCSEFGPSPCPGHCPGRWGNLGDVVDFCNLYTPLLVIILDTADVDTPNSLAVSAYESPNSFVSLSPHFRYLAVAATTEKRLTIDVGLFAAALNHPGRCFFAIQVRQRIHHTRSQWIQMDITHKLIKIGVFLNNNGLIAILK